MTAAPCGDAMIPNSARTRFKIRSMTVVNSELRRRIRRSITFEACLPRKAKEPPNGPGWIHEIKHDGFRILARKDGNRVKLITRNGYDFAIVIR